MGASGATRLTVTGRTTLSPSSRSQTRSRNASSIWSKLSTSPDRRPGSLFPGRVDHGPQIGAEARTRSATADACSSAVEPEPPRVEANGLTANTSAPSLASTFGITKLVEPYE